MQPCLSRVAKTGFLTLLFLLQTACEAGSSDPDATAPVPADAPYRNASQTVEARVEDLLGRMTLAEKIGQMTQAERGAIGAERAAQLQLGSILSGGGSSPRPNKPESWIAMIDDYQSAAAKARLGIPILYGIDAVHGHQSVNGAVIFPHLLGLAATRDEALLRKVGTVTAREMAATGIYWNFSPMIAVSQDLRWGRTYESFGEDPAVVSAMGRAYVEGLMQPLGQGAPRLLPTAKHFIGDGGTSWGSSRQNIMGVAYKLDQGDTRGDTQALLARYLPPYKALVDAGVMSVMASFSSWNGTKLHGETHLLTEVLKGELGFKGFVISDWDAIQQLPGNLREQVTAAVNAGVDMAMVPNSAPDFIRALTQAVERKEVGEARIDDAVRRILRAKFAMGLFEQSRALPALKAEFGGAEHRAVARQAVAESATLLKNEGALPLAQDKPLFLAGALADDLGAQAGGWTLEWQGVRGNGLFPGTNLLTALKDRAGDKLRYAANGRFDGEAETGILVIGERGYAEGVGDRDIDALSISSDELGALDAMRPKVKKLVLVVMAGRPIVIDKALDKVDAVVMVYQPGSEGAGVGDVLFGDAPFKGRLPIGWPMSAKTFTRADAPKAEYCASLQWAAGFGLDATGKPLGETACP
ncbi:glycoside hydrolase family 3 protein [Niveibacterium sp. SC-1]|uniref:glycoside hydrolase family 3 protein n=1 Tax=Niveibacterium sp. SC-1 TaxID=3135646 RepID=UPI00311ED8C8